MVFCYVPLFEHFILFNSDWSIESHDKMLISGWCSNLLSLAQLPQEQHVYGVTLSSINIEHARYTSILLYFVLLHGDPDVILLE